MTDNLVPETSSSNSGLETSPDNVVLVTSKGNITIELYHTQAPRTCTNFTTLVSNGYYNGVAFHRVIRDSFVQGVDGTQTGKDLSSIYIEPFDDEISPLLNYTSEGLVCMANTGPNTNTSQFFMTLAPMPWLNGKFTIFGRVKSGMDVVRRMGKVSTLNVGEFANLPNQPLVLVSARLQKA